MREKAPARSNPLFTIAALLSVQAILTRPADSQKQFVSIDPTEETAAFAEATTTAHDRIHTQAATSGTLTLSHRGQAGAAGVDDYTGVEASREHWVANRTSKRGKDPPPQLELVVCRGGDGGALEWLTEVPSFWRVTILSWGSHGKLAGERHWNLLPLRKATSDSHALAQFLVIRYNKLAEYTVFSPARPLDVNPFFLQILRYPTKLGAVQALSGVLSKNRTSVAPDRISTRTLNSVLIHDQESIGVAKWFAKDHKLQWGTNLAKTYLDLIGLPTWMDERQEVGSFAPKVMFGFEKSRALRHPKRVYEALLDSCLTFSGNQLVLEKLWLMLLGGATFNDSPLLHAP